MPCPWHLTYRRTNGGKWKIGQCSELNQKPQKCKCKRWTTLSKKHFKSILLVFITRPTPFVEWYHTICGRASEKCIQMGRKYKKNRNLENFQSAKTSRSISLCEKKENCRKSKKVVHLFGWTWNSIKISLTAVLTFIKVEGLPGGDPVGLSCLNS